MGRGRQKAKATRQARDIKYYSPATDLSALERELGKNRGNSAASPSPTDVPYESDYSDYEDKYADEEDEDDQRHIS